MRALARTRPFCVGSASTVIPRAGGPARIGVLIGLVLAVLWIATVQVHAKPTRWTERQAERALLARAHVSYADCISRGGRGRRFLCLIEYTDGGEWFLVLVPQRDGFAVR